MRKKLIAVAVLLVVVFAMPSWGASFRNKKMPDEQFLELCKKGDTQGVIEAIKLGANVNAKDKNGTTTLMGAAYSGHTEIVSAQIRAEVDINAKGKDGTTAIMLAAGEGHTEIVNALIKAGTDVNAANEQGITALMFAASGGFTEIVNTLIEGGADDLTDNDGKTALIHAASNGNPETVNALIDAGSYVKQKDKSGKMAVDYARKNNKLKGTTALERLERLSK